MGTSLEFSINENRHATPGEIVDAQRDLGDDTEAALRAGAAAVVGRPASAEEISAAQGMVAAAADRMGRELDTDGLKELLAGSLDDPYWDEVPNSFEGDLKNGEHRSRMPH